MSTCDEVGVVSWAAAAGEGVMAGVSGVGLVSWAATGGRRCSEVGG